MSSDVITSNFSRNAKGEPQVYPFALTPDQRKIAADIVARGMAEDLDVMGDVTTAATVPDKVRAKGRFLAKADGVIAGIEVVDMVFQRMEPSCRVTWHVVDGELVKKGTHFGEVEGSASQLLIAERLALNVMQRMSGVATATHRMVQAVGAHKAKILDTRKTVPGLRLLDKLAVKIGGGMNHRYGLFDMILIKDNHVTAAGGVRKAIESANAYLKKKKLQGEVQIEVETRTLDEVKEVLQTGGVQRIMLDNMVKVSEDGKVDATMLQSAVALIQGKFQTEASGNVTVATVPAIAATGVDFISSGSLTHSVMALDISCKIQLLT